MARKNLIALVLTLLAVGIMLHGSAAQRRHVVGDAIGWTIPSDGATTYATWSANKTFTLGDTLVFNFLMDGHDVAEVTKENFDSCNTISPLAIYNDPPVRLTLNKFGERYFMCAVPGHCLAGQKLAINVTDTGTATSPPSTARSPSPSITSPSFPSSTSSVSPAPQISEAKSIAATAIFATILSIAIAFLYYTYMAL